MKKLLLAVIYILLLVSLDKYNLAGVLLMIIPPLIAFAVSGISMLQFFYKLRFVLPVVFMVGVFNPFFDREPMLYLGKLVVTGGMISFVTLLLKGTLALMASFALMSTTRIEEICIALRKMHIPSAIVATIFLAFRYIPLFMEEVKIMSEGYALRSPGQKGIHISAWGSFLGQLLIRSMDRANEIYNGMLLRGFDGNFEIKDDKG